MRRLVSALGVSVVLLLWAGAPPALAAAPEVNHFTDSWEFVDPDFCGTGQEVEIAGQVVGTEQLAPNHANFTVTFSGHEVFTNPDTGLSVESHWAGRFSDTTVSGDDEGIHVHEFATLGLPESFRLPGGGMITLDAGLITFVDTFDADELIDEVIVQHGPHPEADADFELFCEVMTEALGIA